MHDLQKEFLKRVLRLIEGGCPRGVAFHVVFDELATGPCTQAELGEAAHWAADQLEKAGR